MAYVRGHPGDFDHWEAQGATGWNYGDALPYFIKSEDLAPGNEIPSGEEGNRTAAGIAY